MNDTRLWRVDGFQAHLQPSRLACSVDVQRLQQGLQQLRFQTESLADFCLLRLSLPDLADPIPAQSIQEVYARGNDLIASYLPVSPSRYAPQVYWRARTSENCHGVELMISMQTDTLESRPLIQSSSVVAGSRVWCLKRSTETLVEMQITDQASLLSPDESAPLLLMRAEDESFSYLEMAYPADPFEFWVKQTSQNELGLGFRLLQEHLEKGVIRRFRVAAWFVPREKDLELATKLSRELLQSAPPLTT